MGKTSIEWTERTWNCLRGCSRVSEGCRNCYAEAIAARFSGPGLPYHGLAKMTKSGPRWTGKLELVEKDVGAPLRWQKPAMVFVNSMSDVFHEDIPDEWINAMFRVMGACDDQGKGHIFQILTKRAERMQAYMSGPARDAWNGPRMNRCAFPPRDVWLGVSIEDQQTADERIPLLLQTPAAIRWVSYEPALGPVLFRRAIDVTRSGAKEGEITVDHLTGIDWIVVGGESGPAARPFDLRWALSTIEQCRAAGVPVFVKQLGSLPCGDNANEWDWPLLTPKLVSPHPLNEGPAGAFVALLKSSKGGDPSEWPEQLRVREFPAGKEAAA